MRVRGLVAGVVAVCATAIWGSCAAAQTLAVTYGSRGVQTVAFNGAMLEDTNAAPGDAFHIWHMKATDLNGNAIPGWGESNTGTSWNAATRTETYSFAWGSIQTQFVQQGNTLNLVVTEQNNAGSGIVFDGAEIYPFALHFPQDPVGFSGYTQYAITTTDPGVSIADFGAGVVTAVVPDESVPVYAGWKAAGANTYTPLMTTTAPDGLPTFLPQNDLPVPPGTSRTYTVSLRFTAKGVAADAADAYASFAATYPSRMTWSDHRALGTVYLASSPPAGGGSGFATNPRRWFNDASVDVTTAAGLRAFQNRVLAQAAAAVANTQALNGQGVVTWDIEGEQFPQSTSYVCSPEQIAAVAPEMESTVADPRSASYGQKLDDAYFRTITAAGLRVGVCLRPQIFTLGANNTASQAYLTGNANLVANLEKKARFANQRWGATIFYVDSTVDLNGGTLDPAIFQQLITDLPGFLFIPEETTTRYYAYSAPFYSFLFHTTTGTPVPVLKVYPKAFGANLVNDVAAQTLAAYTPQLTQAVAQGDLLMGHADYWQANDPTIVAIYQAAGAGSAPMQTTPAIQWATPHAIAYGTALGAAQLNATASTLGSFTYSPAAGTVLHAGVTTLLATFTPADTVHYRAATQTVSLTVNKATPAITWAMPSVVTAGTALSATQLNATASVGGSFVYSPAAGTVLSAGTTTLQTTFTPANAADLNSASASVSLMVNAAAATVPALAWSSPAAITYGAALSSAQLNATASIPGSFAYSPGAGSVLPAGANTLRAVFTPADAVHYQAVSASVTLNVNAATPSLAWAAPASVAAGTALSATQLNATASVPGSFVYTPPAGTVLAAGAQTLAVTFTPASANYCSASASVPLMVTGAAAPVSNSRLYIVSPLASASLVGTVVVNAVCTLQLDPAGSYLMVDGVQFGRRLAEGPFHYVLDTTQLTDGPHTLQLWAHDIGNNTTLSAPVTITVAN